MITTPLRFFHKETGLRVEAVETPVAICGDIEDPYKCVLFHTNCRGVCSDVGVHTGSFVYFKEVENENR